MSTYIGFHTEPIGKNFKYFDKLKEINTEAFPEIERTDPTEFLGISHDRGKALALMYNDVFVGFMIILFDDKIAHLEFLAVDKNYRNKGYGKQAVGVFKNMFPSLAHSLAIEVLDESSANYEQRKKRARFYHEHGFYLTNFTYNFTGILTVMTDYHKVCLRDLVNMIKKISRGYYGLYRNTKETFMEE